MTRQVQVCAGGVCDFGYHAVWWPKYRRPVLAGPIVARCEGLIRAKASGHVWPVVTLEIMPDQVHLFVKAHRPDCPSPFVSQFKGFTSRRLRAGIPHLRSRLPTFLSQSYFAATADAVPIETVRQYIDAHNERRWRTERSQ